MYQRTVPGYQQQGRAGLGFFDSGLNPSGWGLAEWATVAGGFFLLGGGALLGFGGGKSARRKKLEVARAEYLLRRAKA